MVTFCKSMLMLSTMRKDCYFAAQTELHARKVQPKIPTSVVRVINNLPKRWLYQFCPPQQYFQRYPSYDGARRSRLPSFSLHSRTVLENFESG